MLWDFLSLFVVVIGYIICIYDLMAFPALLFLISNFFNLNYLIIPLSGNNLFIIGVTIIIIIKYKSYILTIAKDFKKKLAIIIFILTIILPSFFHYKVWGHYPTLFLLDSLKTFWVLIFLLIPVKDISIQRMTFYMLFMYSLSIVLIAPESIFFFKNMGMNNESLGRILHISLSDNGEIIKNYGLRTSHKFIMDDNVYQNIGIMSYSLYWYLFSSLYQRKYKTFIFLFIFTFFQLYILVINQYLNSFICILIIISSFILSVIYEKYSSLHLSIFQLIYKFKTIFVCIFCVCFSFLVLIHYLAGFRSVKNIFDSRFEFSLDTKKKAGTTRLSFFGQGILALVDKPITGVGFMKDYKSSETYSGGSVTRHSTILDNYISFGVIFGTIACFIYLLPIVFLNKMKKISFSEKFIWTSLLLLLFYESTCATFARYSTHRGIYYLIVWFFLVSMVQMKAIDGNTSPRKSIS